MELALLILALWCFQVFVGEDEPADSVVRRFRKAVMQAGVIPECRRRRFHETPQDIVKRKQQNARRRKIRYCARLLHAEVHVLEWPSPSQ
jgi:ribosomal protein S21